MCACVHVRVRVHVIRAVRACGHASLPIRTPVFRYRHKTKWTAFPTGALWIYQSVRIQGRGQRQRGKLLVNNITLPSRRSRLVLWTVSPTIFADLPERTPKTQFDSSPPAWCFLFLLYFMLSHVILQPQGVSTPASAYCVIFHRIFPGKCGYTPASLHSPYDTDTRRLYS